VRTPGTTIVIALLLCAWGLPAAAEEGSAPRSVPTNMELLEGIVHQLVDGTLDKMPLARGDVVLIRCSETHDISWMVEDYLAGRLASLGVSAYLDLPAQEAGEGVPKEQSTRPGKPAEGEPDAAGAARGGDALGSEAGSDTASARGEDALGSEAGSDTASARGEAAGLDEGASGDASGDLGAQIQAAGGAPEGAGVRGRPEGAAAGEMKNDEAEDVGRGVRPLFEKAPAPDKVVDFRISELGVEYTRRWRKSLFGSAMVERSARAAVFFRVLDGADGRVLWTDSGRREKKDIVPEKMLTRLEDIPGLNPSAESEGGGVTRVLEPLIVSGIVVGLVLLFYSSRT
jgi:hypothetical protein